MKTFYEVREIKIFAEKSAEIAAVIRLAFTDIAEEFHLTPQNCPKHPSFLSDSDMLHSLSNSTATCFGAFDNHEKLVGFAAVWPKRKGVYELTRLCVLPARRHVGIGTQLMQAALDYAKAQGAHRIEIGIMDENERLKRWYAAQGFCEGEKKTYVHLPFTVCEMERLL